MMKKNLHVAWRFVSCENSRCSITSYCIRQRLGIRKILKTESRDKTVEALVVGDAAAAKNNGAMDCELSHQLLALLSDLVEIGHLVGGHQHQGKRCISMAMLQCNGLLVK